MSADDADGRVGQKLRGYRAAVRGPGGTGQLTTGPLKKVMFGSIGGIICR